MADFLWAALEYAGWALLWFALVGIPALAYVKA